MLVVLTNPHMSITNKRLVLYCLSFNKRRASTVKAAYSIFPVRFNMSVRLRQPTAIVSHLTNCIASEVSLNRLFIECSHIRLLAPINKGSIKFVLAKVYYTLHYLSSYCANLRASIINKSNNVFNFSCLFVYHSVPE